VSLAGGEGRMVVLEKSPDLSEFDEVPWLFTLKPSRTSDRFELQIFDDSLASFDEKTALTAVLGT
jgi:hypothetical protein